MSAHSRMTAFFGDAPALWTAMKETPDSQYPIGDILLQPISEESEPCDFSGALRIVQLCNTTTADFFPAMWVGEDEYEETLDQYPVYLLDLQEASAPFPSLGNFKAYMTAALEYFINTHPEASLEEAAKAKIAALQEFSDKTIEKGEYTVSIPEDDEDRYDEEEEQQEVGGVEDATEENGEGASPPDADGGEGDLEGEPAAEAQGEGEAEEGDNSLKRKREDDEGAEE